ncbi:ABC transporter ATP-binding protein [Patescibacteria group bacterium]|nr:MAG: ABC transporter ATP-binding protein [Patescibacteria group bacterium]
MEEQTWRKTVGAILGELKPMRWRIVAVFISAAIPVSLGLAQPLTIRWLIDSLASAGQPSWEAVRFPFFALVGLLVASWIGWRVANTVELHVVTRARTAGIARVFTRLSIRSAGFFGDAQSGRLVHHVESFGSAIEQLLNMTVNQMMATVIFVVSFALALARQSLWFAAGFLAWAFVTTYVQYRVAATTRSRRKVVIDRRSEAGGLLADAVGNVLTTKVFARERQEEKEMRASLGRFREAKEKQDLREEWMWGLQDALFFSLQGTLMFMVLRAWASGHATVGDVVLVQGYLAMLFYYLSGQTRMFRQLPSILSEAAPAASWLLEDPDILDVPDAKPLRVAAGAISFEGVRFNYKGGRNVLAGIDLDIKPGEKVAFVGPSGAGKSTMVKMIYRFYDPQKGSVSIDGQDVSKVTQESLRRSLALVPQDPVLFHRTILDNIRYARPKASMKEIEAAAKRARCHDFIKALPDGYDSLVGDRGVKLSGGERQRVAIARALVADAPILVLDEATSSLDSASEALIKEALHEAMRDKTVIVIAHRLSTIMEMDRIVVMERGKIVDQGTHAQLIARKGTYKNLWDLQSGGYLPEVEE